MQKIKEALGQNIRRIREKQNITQEELANLSGLHFTYIGQKERGLRNPTLATLHKISKALRVKSNQILPF